MTPHDVKKRVSNRVVKNWKTTLLAAVIIIVCGALVYFEKVDFQTGIVVGIPALLGFVLKDKAVGL